VIGDRPIDFPSVGQTGGHFLVVVGRPVQDPPKVVGILPHIRPGGWALHTNPDVVARLAEVATDQVPELPVLLFPTWGDAVLAASRLFVPADGEADGDA
jgi:hypothetical protein